MFRLATLVFALVVCQSFARTWEETDVLFQDTQFRFLDKFCYATIGGIFEFTAQAAAGHPNVEILAYHDVDDENSFSEIVNSGHSCEFKRDAAAKTWNITEEPTIPVTGVKGVRPRWWYFAVCDCSTTENWEAQNIVADSIQLRLRHAETELKYDNVTNDLIWSPIWRAELSYDEFGLYEAAIVFAILQIVVTITSSYFFWSYYTRDFNEQIPKYYALVNFAMVLECVSNLLVVTSMGNLVNTGVSDTNAMHVAQFSDLMAQVVMIAIFLFVSRGWMISSVDQSKKSKRSAIEFILMYAIALVILYLWSLGQIHPADARYLYQTEAGLVIVVLRSIMLIAFLQNCVITYYHEREENKKQFYKNFSFVGALWIFSLPLVVIAAEFSDDWNRNKLVTILEGLLNTLCYIFLVLIVRPGSKFAFQQFDVIEQEGNGDENQIYSGVQTMADLTKGSDEEEEEMNEDNAPVPTPKTGAVFNADDAMKEDSDGDLSLSDSNDGNV